MVIRLIEIALFLAAFAGIITQWIIPAIKGTQMFPMFRKQAKLLNELTEVRQTKFESELESQIKKGKGI